MELVQPQSRTARTDDVKQVIKDMQNSPTAAYLRDLSFHERLMLAAMLKCIKKEGVEEIKWGEVCIICRTFSLSRASSFRLDPEATFSVLEYSDW